MQSSSLTKLSSGEAKWKSEWKMRKTECFYTRFSRSKYLASTFNLETMMMDWQEKHALEEGSSFVSTHDTRSLCVWYIHTYIHTYIYTYIHIYIYIYVCIYFYILYIFSSRYLFHSLNFWHAYILPHSTHAHTRSSSGNTLKYIIYIKVHGLYSLK